MDVGVVELTLSLSLSLGVGPEDLSRVDFLLNVDFLLGVHGGRPAERSRRGRTLLVLPACKKRRRQKHKHAQRKKKTGRRVRSSCAQRRNKATYIAESAALTSLTSPKVDIRPQHPASKRSHDSPGSRRCSKRATELHQQKPVVASNKRHHKPLGAPTIELRRPIERLPPLQER